MVHLAGHRAEAAHLPHQPFIDGDAPGERFRQEFTGLFAEIEQDRTGLEDADGLAVRPLGVDDRGDLVVGAELQEARRHLLALGDVHRHHLVRQPHFLQCDRDLAAVRRVPGVQLDGHSGISFPEISGIQLLQKVAPPQLADRDGRSLLTRPVPSGMSRPSRINSATSKKPRGTAVSKSASRARLFEIIRRRSFGRGDVTLASGRKSDFYFNLKPTMLDPEGATLLAELTYEALKDDQLDFIGGLEMGAVPLAGALAQISWIKGHPIAAFFVRKKPKEHGAKLAIEGLPKGETLEGKRVVIVEDVTTTGGSAMKAVESVRETGAEVVLVLTMVDREEGADDTFGAAGLPFRSLYKASEFLRA